MANTKLSHLGSRKPYLGSKGYKKIAALGNGTAKPGDIVGITDATGRVVGADLGASEIFRGILDDLPEIAEDTAIPTDTNCWVIVPESGELYGVRCVDLGGAVTRGVPMFFSATAGALEKQAALNTAATIAYTNSVGANGDLYVEVRWA